MVVSAMSKVTDLLLDSLRKAEAGDQADLDANLKQLHCAALRVLAASCFRRTVRKPRWPASTALIAEFSRIAKGMLMLGERPPRSIDEAVAIGRAALRAADGGISGIAGHPRGRGERAPT